MTGMSNMNSSAAPNMQTYPSPGTVAADGPFYASSSGRRQSSDEAQLNELSQLSRSLAPSMNTASGGAMPDVQEQRLQGPVTHTYEQQSPQTQVHMSHGILGQMDHTAVQYETPDGSSAARKRSKVSRACDECRRKKIRCDATGEDSSEQCSSCRRVGVQCQFSRVPMKRGPSKGYIKELADRVHTLEGAIIPQPYPIQRGDFQASPLQRRDSEEASPLMQSAHLPRKRTHSASLSGELNTPFQSQRTPNSWGPQEQARQFQYASSVFATPQPTSSHPHTFREPNYSSNGLAPSQQWVNPPNPSNPQRRQSSSMDNMAITGPGLADYSAELDDNVIESYYNLIHPTYPLLESKAKMETRLSTCPPSLRKAFCICLSSTVRSFVTANGPVVDYQSSQQVQHLLASQYDDVSHGTLSTNMVNLQIKLLLVLETENRFPITDGQSGPSTSQCLGSAVGLAYTMRLHTYTSPDKQLENDPDSDDKLLRRLWWSLVVMDRWHSSSTSSPFFIPDESVVLYPDDQAVLGDALYHLVRMSIVLGHISIGLQLATDVSPFTLHPAGTINGILIRGELERCREVFPESFFPPSKLPGFHLCYWSLRILVELWLQYSRPQDVMDAAMSIVTQLQQNPTFIGPMTHYATALAALTLTEMCSNDESKEEAEAGLKALVEQRIAPSTWDPRIREIILKRKNSASVQSQHALTASQGLQRLADLATATGEGRNDPSTAESRMETEQVSKTFQGRPLPEHLNGLRKLVRKGYLSMFSGQAQ